MLTLGIELSPAGTRAVVLDVESAAVSAPVWVPHTWLEGLPAGYREQDPAKWIRAVDEAVRQCLSNLGEARTRVGAIGVCGPLRGMVLLDETNRIVRPAKMNGDSSTRRQAEELARGFGGAPGLIELAGQCPGEESAAAECLWLKQHEPAYFERVAKLLTVQDFIAFWLTGALGCSASSASATGLFDIRSREWRRELIDAIDPRLADTLPPVHEPEKSRGALRGDLAAAWGLPSGLVVSAGGPAPAMVALAAGCVGTGVTMALGSETAVLGCGPMPLIDLLGELSGYCDGVGGWLCMAMTQSAALAPEVVRRHYGWAPERYEEMAAQVPPGAEGLLMLPYVSGERTPRLRDGSGVLHGITPENFTAGHMARAALEGVALGLGYALSRMRDLGLEPAEIRLTGAACGGPLLRRLLADVTGLPVITLARQLDAAAGAAMHAAVAYFHQSGEPLGFDEMAKYLVAADAEPPTEPDLRLLPLYQSLLSRQQYLVETLYSAGFL